jgi:hypothetical protein
MLYGEPPKQLKGELPWLRVSIHVSRVSIHGSRMSIHGTRVSIMIPGGPSWLKLKPLQIYGEITLLLGKPP